tara:strand:+ start:2226 stop:2849 length:624 start_codon:yes stop_codon:yes gene_type:complete
MKKFLAGILAAGLIFTAFSFSKNELLGIGEKAPLMDTKMPDVSGKEYSLNDLKKENGLLVIFSCNTCPYVIAWEDTYPELGKLTQSNNVGMALVNSNEAKRNGDDSMDEMKNHFKKAGYNSAYVIDSKSMLADAFGARTTPHVYLFNSDMELVYRGAIDNKYETQDDVATKFYLNDAINALAKGEKINPAETKQTGCSIKRVRPKKS